LEFDPTFLCYKCNKPFVDELDWDNRHSDENSGEDIHADCCDLCRLPGTKKKGQMTTCIKCHIELVSCGSPNDEPIYQFDNALWIGFFGGYGMFVDNMTDFEETPPSKILKSADYEAVLCHECAHEFVDLNPWIKTLFHPLSTHSHTATYLEQNPDHVGWDTLWHEAENEVVTAYQDYDANFTHRDLGPVENKRVQEIMHEKIQAIKEKEGLTPCIEKEGVGPEMG
jgi:hypothetical protein